MFNQETLLPTALIIIVIELLYLCIATTRVMMMMPAQDTTGKPPRPRLDGDEVEPTEGVPAGGTPKP